MLFTGFQDNASIGKTSFVNHYADVDFNMIAKKIEPTIRQAVDIYILRWISEPFYDALIERFNESNEGQNLVTGDENLALNGINLIFKPENHRILRSLQDAIAHYAVHMKAKKGGAILSELGFHHKLDSDGQVQLASQWQFFSSLYQIMRDADAFFERFLSFCYDNQNEFNAFKMEIETFFINSPKELSQFIAIGNGLMTFFNLLPSMRKMATDEVKPLLGQDLFDNLLKKSRENTADGNHKKLEGFVKAFLAPLSLIHGIPSLNVDLEDGKLFTVSTSDGYKNRKAATDGQIDRLIDQLHKDAKSAKGNLMRFLNDNAEEFGITNDYETQGNVIESTNSVGIFK